MVRLPVVTCEHVPEPCRQAFDELTADSPGVITAGPGSITIHSPEMGHDAQTAFMLKACDVPLPDQCPELRLPVSCRRQRSWPRLSPGMPPRHRASHRCRAVVP